MSCSCSKCASFKNSKGFWLVYADQTAPFQTQAGCKCVSCQKLYTLSGDKWDEVSDSHSISRAPQPAVKPPPTLHESAAIHLISSSATFLDTPFGMALRSPPHNDSVVYLHKGECHIAQHQTECILQYVDNILKFDTKYSDMQPLGAVLDTGAQRGATGTPAEILSRTGTTLNMQPAMGTAKKKKICCLLESKWKIKNNLLQRKLQAFSWVLKQSISMANPLSLLYQMSVYDPGMSDSLISAGRLMEAGYNVNFRTPGDALTNGFAPDTFPLYRGSITTPDNLTVIVMEYVGDTWRLPKVRAISKSVPVTAPSPEDSEDIECFTDVSTCNSFAGLLLSLTTTMRHTCQISSRSNASRDACTSV